MLGTVRFTSCKCTTYSAQWICGCWLCLRSILPSSSSCWHLIFTHQFFSRWLNTAVRCTARHFTNICRHVSPLWVQQPWDGLNLSPFTDTWGSFIPPFSLSHKRAHKLLTDTNTTSWACLPSPSPLGICAKALGVVGGVSQQWSGSTEVVQMHDSS